MKQLLPKLLNHSYSLLFVLSFLFSSLGWGQSIIAGSNTATCGTSYSFTDPGGAGNYGNNQHVEYYVCPSIPPGSPGGTYVSVSFSSISMSADYDDNLIVLNGNAANDANLPAIGVINAADNLTTVTYTSSSPDGCLSFIFISNNANVATGFTANVTACSVSPGSNTFNCNEYNCMGGCARTICGSGCEVYSWIASGSAQNNFNELSGTTAPGNSGCLGSDEQNNVWYYINPASPGTLEMSFSMTSNGGGQDYDFAVWQGSGGTYSCPGNTNNNPIRCSWATMGMGTGLGNGATDTSEGSGGDGWVAPITITQADIDAGVTFSVLLNIYTTGNPSNDVKICFTGTAILDCTPLSIELVRFSGIRQERNNYLYWETKSEFNNAFFTLERSRDGTIWEIVGYKDGAGTSDQNLFYNIMDENFYSPITYYRLKQTDFDGKFKYSSIIALSSIDQGDDWIGNLMPNPASESFSIQYNGRDFETPVSLIICDLTGRAVLEEEIVFSKDLNYHTVDTRKLSKGMYKVQMRQGSNTEARTLVLTNI